MAGENKEYMDQLHAYALGCLDKEEIVKLRSYIHSGEQYNWQELGEYQNLAALLPSILNIETPEPQLKDKVARKLYRIRDEIRAKRSSDLSGIRMTTPQTAAGKAPQQENLDFEETAEEPAIPEKEEEDQKGFPDMRGNFAARTQEFEVVTSSRKTSEFFRPLRETPLKEEAKVKPAPEKPATEDLSNFEKPAAELQEEEEDTEFYNEPPSKQNQAVEEKEEKSPWIDYHEEFPPNTRRRGYVYSTDIAKGSKFSTILIVILLAVIAAGVYGYLNISSEVNTYKDEIESLNQQINNLSAGTSNTTEMAEMQRLLGMQETQIISLAGAENNSYGKIIINLNEGKGFLTLGRVAPLGNDQAYQLWISTSARNFVSLGLFRNMAENKYYVFDLPEIQDQNNVHILLTVEPAAGSQQPGNNIHLGATL